MQIVSYGDKLLTCPTLFNGTKKKYIIFYMSALEIFKSNIYMLKCKPIKFNWCTIYLK